MSAKYVEDLLDVYNMRNSKSVQQLVPQPLTTLSSEEHRRYRTAVCELLWLALVKPELALGQRTFQEI